VPGLTNQQELLQVELSAGVTVHTRQPVLWTWLPLPGQHLHCSENFGISAAGHQAAAMRAFRAVHAGRQPVPSRSRRKCPLMDWSRTLLSDERHQDSIRFSEIFPSPSLDSGRRPSREAEHSAGCRESGQPTSRDLEKNASAFHKSDNLLAERLADRFVQNR